jgi:hypothetical protein
VQLNRGDLGGSSPEIPISPTSPKPPLVCGDVRRKELVVIGLQPPNVVGNGRREALEIGGRGAQGFRFTAKVALTFLPVVGTLER